MLGMEIPATSAILKAAGADYLTRAFRASGALAADNRIVRITQAEPCFGGGTGSKMLLALEYQNPTPELPEQLFVKFSRNFDDPMRDYSRHMMVPEVKFAALSRSPGFPITVPNCLFADVEADSGTGLIITERIAFGEGGLEPLYPKCMDYAVPDPLEHYRAIIRTLAALSGSHKAGRLAPAFGREFPFEPQRVLAADPLRYPEEKLLRRASRIAEFIGHHPQLFPDNLTTEEFRNQFLQQFPLLIEQDTAIKQFLYSNPDLVALCHWNANIDNGWYWRDAEGHLQCGLIDWGRVGQMSVAQAIYGAFSSAEKPLWDRHLEEILELFIDEYASRGAPLLELDELRLHTLLVTATMGMAYLMDAPAIIERQIADPGQLSGPEDPQLQNNEDARVQLHMLTMFLNQWQTRDFGALVKRVTSSQEKPL